MASPNPDPQQFIENDVLGQGSAPLPPPHTNNGKISEQQAAIDALKKGDLVLLTTERSNTKKVLLVIDVNPSDGTVNVWEPGFSPNNEPATWSVSGMDFHYTPLSQTEFYPVSVEAKRAAKRAADSWHYIGDAASQDVRETLQPLREGEATRVNPTGLEVMKLYWGGCPYCVNRHMFCPGCGGVSMTFPDLFMGCGASLSCPMCMGYEFAYQDMMTLKSLEYGNMNKEAEEKLVNERRDRIDARRVELGYPKVKMEELS